MANLFAFIVCFAVDETGPLSAAGIGVRRLLGGNGVFAGGPVAEVDQAAPLAAKGKFRIAECDLFLTNGTLHTAIWISGAVVNAGGASVGGSSVPTTS